MWVGAKDFSSHLRETESVHVCMCAGYQEDLLKLRGKSISSWVLGARSFTSDIKDTA